MLIVTASDDNYVAGVLVLIASTAFHNFGASFAVLDMGISEDNRRRIDELGSLVDVDIRRIEVSEESFANLTVRRAHLNRSAYLRLLIPSLFPTEDRIIYMDCDMVVMGDLSDLDRVELGYNIGAAVPCPSPDRRELLATGIPQGSYINSGLLVMNLPIWRQESMMEQCLNVLSDPSVVRMCEDQSAINIVGRGRIVLLDPRFNIYTDPSSYGSPNDFPSQPAVLHYVVNNKPWYGPTAMGEVWEGVVAQH